MKKICEYMARGHSLDYKNSIELINCDLTDASITVTGDARNTLVLSGCILNNTKIHFKSEYANVPPFRYGRLKLQHCTNDGCQITGLLDRLSAISLIASNVYSGMDIRCDRIYTIGEWDSRLGLELTHYDSVDMGSYVKLKSNRHGVPDCYILNTEECDSDVVDIMHQEIAFFMLPEFNNCAHRGVYTIPTPNKDSFIVLHSGKIYGNGIIRTDCGLSGALMDSAEYSLIKRLLSVVY